MLSGVAETLMEISIHAPRTGSDQPQRVEIILGNISIHAPRTGSDMALRMRCAPRSHFNPRSPHGERRLADVVPAPQLRISIHAPRTGSDGSNFSFDEQPYDFNPRSPHGERPALRDALWRSAQISIHAPRTGSDGAFPTGGGFIAAFQSTLPARGATPRGKRIRSGVNQFQSTLPARGATEIS